MNLENVRQVCFGEIFDFATKEFGIEWNPCNDVFFGNAFEYNTVSDFEVGCWWQYCEPEMKWFVEAVENDEDILPSRFSKEEILSMNDVEQSYTITALFFERQGITSGSVQIDSR